MKSNQKNFLEEFAQNYHIKKPEDWGRITQKVFIEEGGIALLLKYGSIFQVLRAVFPGTGCIASNAIETSWKEEWFNFHEPPGYWKSKENRRKFLLKYAQSKGIKEPKEWSKATVRDIQKQGGSYLKHLYNGSIFRALQDVFPDVNWQREWFPNLKKYEKGYWREERNQRKFLDLIAAKYNLQQPSDWNRVTQSLIRQNGGQVRLDNIVLIAGPAEQIWMLPSPYCKYDLSKSCIRFCTS